MQQCTGERYQKQQENMSAVTNNTRKKNKGYIV